MSNTTTSFEEFEAIILKAQTEKTAAERDFSTRTLVWLALPPFWSLSLAEMEFPIDETNGVVKGEKVRALFERLERGGWIVKESDSDPHDNSIFVMPSLQKARVINEIVREKLQSEVSGLKYLQDEIVEISKSIHSNLKKSERMPSFVLYRWLELARHADFFERLSDYFNSQVDNILTSATDAGQTSAPEALRWIEAFIPFVGIFGSQLEVALTRARRQYEIFNRRAYDRRYLDNKYLIRQEQDDAFVKLMNTSDENDKAWALHYVGKGGMGKTMLMRHINADLATEHNLAVARVDFDYLNPDYPARQPGLLLLSFAVELSAYLGGSRGFQKFEKQVREWHRHLAFEKMDRHADFNIDYQLESLIYIFVGELRRLKNDLRPLLILDTCEELAKLRPDGSLPESVRVTFEVLEMIHKLMPRLRVVFSGRRPLAKKGFGWSLNNISKESPLNKLTERDYLMLHEIRGFDKDEADEFLRKYKNGKVPPQLFEAIRKLSVVEEKTATPLFVFHEENGAVSPEKNSLRIKDEVRYNPFDLDIYAAWTADKPDLSEQKLKEGAHFYIKERLVERINPNLKKRLSEITLLGRFDRAILRELYPADDGSRFDVFFDELITQEWIDTERSVSSFPGIETSSGEAVKNVAPTIWGMHENMRARLLAYFKEEKIDELKSANKQVAQLLEQVTLKRDWRDLSISYFESAVQTLTEWNSARAADWWKQIEAKLADTARWDWAYSLTNQLLADEGVAGRKEKSLGQDPETENVLRPAILATHAAALIHLRMPDVLSVWVEVREKCNRHPIVGESRLLEIRASFGICAAQISRSEEMAAKFTATLKHELIKLCADTELTLNKYPQLFASALAAIEQTVEICEQIQKENADLIEDEKLNLCLDDLKTVVLEILARYSGSVPGSLQCFLHNLCGRLALLIRDWDTAKEQFENSIGFIDRKRFPGERNRFQPIWLDWLSPEAFESRVELEYLRGTSPRFYTPGQIRQISSLKSDGEIDSDKVNSAVSTLSSYFRVPWSDIIDHETYFDESYSLYQNLRPETKTVNAHNEFPPYFIFLLEKNAFSGQLASAVLQARELTQTTFTLGTIEVQKDIEKTMARLTFWFRLQDERSYNFGEKLKESNNLDDIKLGAMLEAVANRTAQTYWHQFSFYINHPLAMAAYAYYLYRAGQLGIDPLVSGLGNAVLYKLFDKTAKADESVEIIYEHLQNIQPHFFKSAFMFAQAEFEIRKKNKGFISLQKTRELAKLIREVEDVKDYVGAFTLDVLLASLTAQLPSMVNAEKIGLRRAAWIMLEEGMLLSIRRPKAAIAILQQTARLFSQLEDFIGEIISDLSIGLLAIKFNKPRNVKKSLYYLREDYQKLCEQEYALPPWSELTGCIKAAISGENTNSIFDFLNNQSKNLAWRPMLARMLHCLAWDVTSGAENAAVSSLRGWINSNYGRFEENELVVPADFDFKQNLTATETELSEIECVISSDKPADVNFPLGSPLDILLKSQSPIINDLPVKSRILATSDVDITTYRIQSTALPPEISQALQQEINESSEDLLPLKLFFSNSSTVAAPWEAVFGFSASESEEDYYPRFMYRRVLERTYTPRTGIMPARAGVLSYVADNYITEMVYEGWNALASDDRFSFNVFQGSEIDRLSSDSACLLHLVGVPIETPQMVNLEIISTDFESADVSSYAEQLNYRSAIIEAASLAERFSQLRVVVVQSPPRFEEPRTPTDRFEIAKLRRFCADVFQTGVGAVIMLPSLKQELNMKCLEQLAKLFSSPVEVRVEDVMLTVHEIQELIADSAHSDKNDAVELSFDVCLYMHDSFEWHVV